MRTLEGVHVEHGVLPPQLGMLEGGLDGATLGVVRCDDAESLSITYVLRGQTDNLGDFLVIL